MLLQPRAWAIAGGWAVAIRSSLAIATVFVAVISSGNGATIGVSLALLLCLLPRSVPRRRARALAAVILLGTLVQWWLLYYDSAAPRTLADLGAAALYALQVLGTPLALMEAPADPTTGIVGGILSLTVILLASLRVLRHRELLCHPLGWIAATLLPAVGASIVGIALIRAGGDYGPFDVKYLHYALVLLPASLVLLLLPTPGHTVSPSRFRAVACCGVVLLLVALNTALAMLCAIERAKGLNAMRTSIPGFQLIADDSQLHGYVPPAETFAGYQLMLRERQLAYFAPGANTLLGSSLDHVAPRQIASCKAGIHETVTLRSRDPARPNDGVLRVDLISFAATTGADAVAFSKAGEEQIVGYALVLAELRGLPELPVSMAWRGYLATEPETAAYDVWLLDRASGTRCLAVTFSPP